jgi:hypothetical protein
MKGGPDRDPKPPGLLDVVPRRPLRKTGQVLMGFFPAFLAHVGDRGPGKWVERLRMTPALAAISAVVFDPTLDIHARESITIFRALQNGS